MGAPAKTEREDPNGASGVLSLPFQDMPAKLQLLFFEKRVPIDKEYAGHD